MRALGRGTKRVDFERLEARARESIDGEAYFQLSRSEACRIGVTAAVSKPGKVSFSIEVLITAMNIGTGEALSGLNDLVETVKLLNRRGYHVDHQGDGWLVAWKKLKPRSINAELSQIVGIVQKGNMRERKVERGV